MRSPDRFRLVATALVALLLGQSAGALLTHVHGARPVGSAPVAAAADPFVPASGSAVHGLADCRACRLRAERDRHAPAPALRPLAADRPAARFIAPRGPVGLAESWWPGSRPARAPPVLS